jgi:hypothetical protein
VHAPTRHRKLLITSVVTALVLLGALGVGALWWNRRGPSQPSIDRAVDRFRSSDPAGSADTSMQPQPGVYLYAGTGEERLSFLATHQSQEGILPGTVTRVAGGCWTFAIDYNSYHHQTWDRCAVDGRLVARGDVTEQKFDFGPLSQSERTVVRCRRVTTLYDPSFVSGHRGPVQCSGHSATTKANLTQNGHTTFVGRTTVRVGTTRVPALHYVQDVTISGDQTGSSHEAVWLRATDGLPLREQRTVSVVSPAPAPINHVTYSEHGSWQLTSLTPRS